MRAIIRVIAVFLFVTTAIQVSPASAQVGVLDVTCSPPSSAVVTYDPPLTNQPQIVGVTVSFQYGPCVSVSQPALISGSHGFRGTLTTSCLDLLRANDFVMTITWNTGQTSTLSGNRSTTIVGATIVGTSTGTVTAGLFTGDTFVLQLVGPATDILLCTVGLDTVSSVYNTLTLEITSV